MTQEALKLALEALERFEGNKKLWPEAITAIKEALAQTQEPVAWRNAAIRVGEALSSVGPDGYYDMTAQQWLDWALSVVTVHAPPPQRTWVGLTDEEENEYNYLGPDMHWVIQEISAKLKEKNA